MGLIENIKQDDIFKQICINDCVKYKRSKIAKAEIVKLDFKK
jgi:hypothetical protein